MFCTACATHNPTAARQCVGCGARLDGEAGERWGLARAAGRAPRRRRHLVRLLHLIPIVVLLATTAAGVDRYRDDRAAQAAAYDRAVLAEDAGRLDQAVVEYGLAGDYRDADVRRAAAAAALAPYRTAYLDGIAALDAGRFDEAIALLVPVVRDLPTYEDAAVRLAEARERRHQALLATADAAEARGDWLTAERALGQLLAEDPDDPALAARLTALRRDHAPLLFTRDHQLFMIGPDLDGERLITDEVPSSWPIWSPDRSRIAFLAQDETAGDVRLFVVNADGSGLRLLANEVWRGNLWPSWSPDGTRIAYTSQAAFDGVNGRARFSVRIVDVATGAETNLTQRLLRFAASPTWSPAGDRLAMMGLAEQPQPDVGRLGVEIYILDLASGTLTEIGNERFPNTVYLTWSPTADRLLLYEQRPQTYRSPASSTIHQLDLVTGELLSIDDGAQLVWLPIWSPDGSRFAYVEGDTVIRVRMSRGRGEAWINVATPLIGFLSWSPDGSALFAAAASPQEPSYLIPLADGLGQEEGMLLTYDLVLPNAGPPMWGPFQPAAVDGPPTVGGTARDLA